MDSAATTSAPKTAISEQPAAASLHHDLAHDFVRLKKAVLDKRPILKEIIDRWGQKTLLDYAQDYFSVNLNPPIKLRQDELISTVRSMVQEHLGLEQADATVRQLQNYYFVNTQDHLGPITHPWSFNANLLIAAPHMQEKAPDLRAVISFACANVSLNNTSFPRGLLFHSSVAGNVKLHRLSFLPSNAHACAAYGFRSYTSVDLDKIRKHLRQLVRDGEVNAREGDIIHDILAEIYDQPDILACEQYAAQIIKTNHRLWKKFFPANGKSHPDFINLEQETLVIRLLIDFHLHQDTVINHLLFDGAYDQLVMRYFDGVPNAFTLSEQRGTYLFWGISKEKNYRVQLWKRGSELVSPDGSLRIPLKPEALRDAMERREIVPSIMLIFTVLSFYYGLKCLGGFSQVNYLTFMKNAYIKMQVDRGNYKSIEVCARAQTKEIVDGTFAFMETPDKSVIPATGLDMMLYGDQNRWNYLYEELKTMTVEDALNPGMSEFYRFIYVGEEADPSLMAITPREIAALTGLDQRMRPFTHILDYPSSASI